MIDHRGKTKYIIWGNYSQLNEIEFLTKHLLKNTGNGVLERPFLGVTHYLSERVTSLVLKTIDNRS